VEARRYRLGDYIDAYCRKCKLNLDCNVAALMEGEVVQVQCRTCLTVQKYQPPVDESVKKEKILRKVMKMRENRLKLEAPSTEKEKPEPAAGWEALMASYNPAKGKVYDRRRKYSTGDFILHKTFGVGLVLSIDDDNTLDVIFRESREKLESCAPFEDL